MRKQANQEFYLKNDYNGMKLEINKVEKWKVHKYLEIKHTLKQSMSQKVKYKWNKKTLWMSKNEKNNISNHIRSMKVVKRQIYNCKCIHLKKENNSKPIT